MSPDNRRPLLSLPPPIGRSRGVFARAEELWDAWAFAAVEAELALDAWKKATHGLKETAFATYRAALDREEQAAAHLATRIAPKVGERLRRRSALASSGA
jgi:hypothetical protein